MFPGFGLEQLNVVLTNEVENTAEHASWAERINELHKRPHLPLQQHFRWEEWGSEKLSDHLYGVTIKDNTVQIGSSALITKSKVLSLCHICWKIFPGSYNHWWFGGEVLKHVYKWPLNLTLIDKCTWLVITQYYETSEVWGTQLAGVIREGFTERLAQEMSHEGWAKI